MKLSLLSLATLVGAAVADLDPIIIKVIQTHQTGLKGGLHFNSVMRTGLQVLLL